MKADYQEMLLNVADAIRDRGPAIVLTGAGMSVDSGVPAFRGSQGLWAKYDPMEVASIEALERDPGKVWSMLLELDDVMEAARPNEAHLALSHMEEMGLVSALITQNIDGLHQMAGSKKVIEFHGNARKLRCTRCRKPQGRDRVDPANLPPLCACGGVVKPDIIFFGEAIDEGPLYESFTLAAECGVMLVVGTSAVVAPASQLPVIAKQNGALVAEFNLEPTPLSHGVADYSILENASISLAELVKVLT